MTSTSEQPCGPTRAGGVVGSQVPPVRRYQRRMTAGPSSTRYRGSRVDDGVGVSHSNGVAAQPSQGRHRQLDAIRDGTDVADRQPLLSTLMPDATSDDQITADSTSMLVTKFTAYALVSVFLGLLIAFALEDPLGFLFVGSLLVLSSAAALTYISRALRGRSEGASKMVDQVTDSTVGKVGSSVVLVSAAVVALFVVGVLALSLSGWLGDAVAAIVSIFQG